MTVDDQPAYALTKVIGELSEGDFVVVNTTAVDLGLGTGGHHVVLVNLTRPEVNVPGAGHVMKLRYTGEQSDTGVAEEDVGQESWDVPGLDGMPVVVLGVHSQLAGVAAGIGPDSGLRTVFVMTDVAALPLALSDLVADLSAVGALAGTISAGQSFGGDLEAVNVASGLWLARHRLEADIAIVGPGPGGVGTGSRLGFSALEQAPILDMAGTLGAVPVATLRWSDTDERPRHAGLSHHSSTVLGLTCRRVEVAVPRTERLHEVLGAIRDSGIDIRHDVWPVEVGDVAGTLARMGLAPTSMGRTVDEDPLYWDLAASAGTLATMRARSVA